jgi:hypothetical protein
MNCHSNRSNAYNFFPEGEHVIGSAIESVNAKACSGRIVGLGDVHVDKI